MHIFYINLDHRQDRRKFLEGQLEQLGLEGTRVSAVTPAEVDPALIEAHAARPPLTSLTPPELACAASHRKAWGQMLELGLPHALFLEDDVRLSPRLPTFLVEMEPHVGRFDVIRLETHCELVCVGPRTLQFNQSGVSLRGALSLQLGLAGYILTAHCAARLLARPGFFDLAIDHLFFDPRSDAFSTLEARQCIPALCIQGDVFDSSTDGLWHSDIELERRQRFNRVDYKEKKKSKQQVGFAGKVLREVRRLQRQVTLLSHSMTEHLDLSRRWMVIPFAESNIPPSRRSLRRFLGKCKVGGSVTLESLKVGRKSRWNDRRGYDAHSG